MAESVRRYGARVIKKPKNHKQKFDLNEYIATILCLVFISKNKMITNKHRRKAKEFIDVVNIDAYKNNEQIYVSLSLAFVLAKCVVEFNYTDYNAIKKKALDYVDLSDEFELFFEDFENDQGFIISGDHIESELSTEQVSFIDQYISDRLQFYYLWKVAPTLRETADSIEMGDIGDMSTFIDHTTTFLEEFLYQAKKSRSLSQHEQADFTTDDDSFSEAVRVASEIARRPSNKIATGVKMLNHLLNGGYEGGRTYVYFANSGGWKSGILLSSALWACDPRINSDYTLKDQTKEPCVLYLTGENDRNETIGRMVSFSLGSHYDLESSDPQEVIEQLSEIMEDGSAKFDFKFRPSRSINTNDIENMIEDLALNGREVVMLVADYIKRFRPVETFEQRHLELGAVVDELSMLAKKYNIPAVTANQLNREAYAKLADELAKNNFDALKKVNESNVGESINVVENADDVIFLRNNEMAELNKRFCSFNRVKKRGKNNSKITFFHQPYDHDENGDINGMKLVEDFDKPMKDIAGCEDISGLLGSGYDPNNPAGGTSSGVEMPKRSSKRAARANSAHTVMQDAKPKKESMVKTLASPSNKTSNEEDPITETTKDTEEESNDLDPNDLFD